MSHLIPEIELMFSDLANAERADMDLALLYRGKERYAKEKKDRADNWILDQMRKRSNCEYVKRREEWDVEYRLERRARSLHFSRELQVAREAVAIDRWWGLACPLPCMVVGRDIPEPKAARLKPRVDEKRRRHAEQERARRVKAKRVDSMPLLERSVA